MDAGVFPRLKVGGLLAGVAAGIVLPAPPNKEGFAAACVACAPVVPDAAPPPNKLVPELAGAAAGVVVPASLLPKLKPPPPPNVLPVVPPNGFAAGVELAAAPPNRLGVEDAVAAGLAPPKREDVGC